MTMEATPAWQLAHRVPKRPAGVAEPSQAVEQWYELHPIPVGRPAEDEITAPVVCGACGESVDLVVASLAVRDRRREAARSGKILYRWLQALGIVAGLGAFAGLVAGGRSLSGGMLILLMVVMLGAGFGAFAANDAAVDCRRDQLDDGVRLAGPSALHDIRDPGNDRDYSMQGDGYDPGGGE